MYVFNIISFNIIFNIYSRFFLWITRELNYFLIRNTVVEHKEARQISTLAFTVYFVRQIFFFFFLWLLTVSLHPLFVRVEFLKYREILRRQSRGMVDKARVMWNLRYTIVSVHGNQARTYPHGEYTTDLKKITTESFVHSFMSPQRRIFEVHFRAYRWIRFFKQSGSRKSRLLRHLWISFKRCWQ